MTIAQKIIGALGLSAVVGGVAAGSRYEAPPFEVVTDNGEWQLRRYTPVIEARVTVDGEFDQAVSDGFRVLAGYIFERGRPEGKIAMTVPVAAQPDLSDTLATASPVDGDLASAGSWTVAFTMPSKWTLDTLPQPDDPRVTLVRTEPALVAVRAFSSNMSIERADEERQKLESDLADAGLVAIGPAVVAQYNPPWTPGFMRTNEVQVPVRAAGLPQ